MTTVSVLRARHFLSQLKKRKVVRVALVYFIVAVVVLLIGKVVFDDLALPSWSPTLFLALILLGFPIALILSWVYEVTPLGVRKDSAGHIESVTDLESHRLPSTTVLAV